MPTYRVTFKYIAKAHVDIVAPSLSQARIDAVNTPRSHWTWPPLDVDSVDVISHEIAVMGPAIGDPPSGSDQGGGYD